MDVAPFAKFLLAVDVIVCHVHAAGVSYATVDDHNLTVVAVHGFVNPRESQRVELVDFYPFLAQQTQMTLMQRTVVGTVAKAVEEDAHLDAGFHALGEQREQRHRNTVVAEVEILHVDGLLCLRYGGEEVVKLLLSGSEHDDSVVFGEGNVPSVLQPLAYMLCAIGRRLSHLD